MTEELKPCPFCGGKAKIKLVDWGVFNAYRHRLNGGPVLGRESYGTVHCSKCGVETKLGHAGRLLTVKTAINYWNRRAYDEQ